MIKLLADLFRGVSMVMGISAPPPGQNERRFVFLWLGMLGFLAVSCVLIFYLVLKIAL
jgi:hypothetical protein